MNYLLILGFFISHLREKCRWFRFAWQRRTFLTNRRFRVDTFAKDLAEACCCVLHISQARPVAMCDRLLSASSTLRGGFSLKRLTSDRTSVSLWASCVACLHWQPVDYEGAVSIAHGCRRRVFILWDQRYEHPYRDMHHDGRSQ